MIRRTSPLIVLLAVASFVTADAQGAGRLAAVRAARATANADIATASLRAAQPMPPVELVSPACCAQPCLIYRHHGHHRACCGCAPPVEMVLTATDPCTCCPVAIPVCVPGCCAAAPTVSCHRGLFGASVQEFDWPCGYRVTVRFKHNGDVLVITRG